jgi:hypothetical protein
MTCDLPRPFVRALAAATLLGSVGLPLSVSWAQTAASVPSGTAVPAPATSTPPGAPMPEDGARPPALDPMTQRINYLHGRLRITRAQEPLWAGLTQVMRDNATALAPLLRGRFQATQGGNAIEMLGAGEKLDAVQLDGLRKFIAAFQALYESMSDEQRKIADYVFRRSPLSEESAAPPYFTYLSVRFAAGGLCDRSGISGLSAGLLFSGLQSFVRCPIHRHWSGAAIFFPRTGRLPPSRLSPSRLSPSRLSRLASADARRGRGSPNRRAVFPPIARCLKRVGGSVATFGVGSQASSRGLISQAVT